MATLTERFPHCKQEILETLVEYGLLNYFSHIMSYRGDDELISSCNDEYNCDDNVSFITDGISNHTMAIANADTDSAHLQYIHSIRGATFVIMVTEGEDKWDLRIDESCYRSAVIGIRRILERFNQVNAIEDMKYYLNESKPGYNYCFHNGDGVISN